MSQPPDKRDLSVILPTYNESGNIVPLVRGLKEKLPGITKEILVVDDNSPDGTAELVQKEFDDDGEVKVVVRYNNRGLANSIREGIEKCSGEIIVVMDTDFNHKPEDVPLLFELAKHIDIVVGSRFIYGGGMSSRARYFLSYLYNIFMRLTIGTRVDDNLSGFFSIRRDKLFSLDFDSIFRGYGDYFFRLLLLAQKERLHLVEIPVYYGMRKTGDRKTSFIPIFLKYTKEVLRIMIQPSKWR